MPATLHTERLTADGGTPDRWLYLLHGIYGAGRNWNAVSRRLVEDRPDWGVLAIDLRGHGRSDRGAPPHTLDACVEDLTALISEGAPAPDAVLGHSFGGKVATLFAATTDRVGRLVVVDSPPGERSPEGSAWEMLGVLRRHPGPFPDRSAGIAAVVSEGYPRPVAQWMGTNLERADGNGGDHEGEGDSWRWRLDPDQMEALLRNFFRTDAWPALRRAAESGTTVDLIRATESSVVDASDRLRAEALGEEGLPVHLLPVEGGHWLNADNPDRVVELLAERLSR